MAHEWLRTEAFIRGQNYLRHAPTISSALIAVQTRRGHTRCPPQHLTLLAAAAAAAVISLMQETRRKLEVGGAELGRGAAEPDSLDGKPVPKLCDCILKHTPINE